MFYAFEAMFIGGLSYAWRLRKVQYKAFLFST